MHEEDYEKTVTFGCIKSNLTIANIIFGFLSVFGQFGYLICLPLWIDSGSSIRNLDDKSEVNASSKIRESITSPLAGNKSDIYIPRIDPIFILCFTNVTLLLAFAILLLIAHALNRDEIGETERKFSQLQFVRTGILDAAGWFFASFAGSGNRTSPSLQSILINAIIPLTIIVRYIVLRKVPTIRQFLCAMVVLVSLFICLLPKIFPSVDSEAVGSGNGANGVAGILWPLCFMMYCVPISAFTVYVERTLTMKLESTGRTVNLIFFLFWSHVYKLLFVVCIFWANLIPGFGYADNIHNFWENMSFGFKCFFGGRGCGMNSGTSGALYIFSLLCNVTGTSFIRKHGKGATFSVLLSAVGTPLCFLFWTLFRESPFGFHPNVTSTTWCNIAGLVLMMPAIFIYNIESQHVAVPQSNDDETENERTHLLQIQSRDR